MASNRERALAAAIEILASEGIRALTHRQVDRRAGLPEGSTSNAFRTRDALLLGVTEHMVVAELPAIAKTLEPETPERFADSLVALFEHLIGPLRVQTAARLALFVEAGHDRAIRDALHRGRSAVAEPIRSGFRELGAPDPELAVRLLASCFEGLFFQVLGGYADLDHRPVIAAAVRAGLTPSGAAADHASA